MWKCCLQCQVVMPWHKKTVKLRTPAHLFIVHWVLGYGGMCSIMGRYYFVGTFGIRNSCRGETKAKQSALKCGWSRLQAADGRLLTSETRLFSRSVHVGFFVDKESLLQDFWPGPSVSLVSLIPSLLHIDSCVFSGMDTGSNSAPALPRHSLTQPQQFKKRFQIGP
jgi:hypothetical protein